MIGGRGEPHEYGCLIVYYVVHVHFFLHDDDVMNVV